MLLAPLRFIYYTIVSLRNFLFDKRWIRIESFDIPVISVGNLTAGGTGKTPLIIYLLGQLQGIEQKIAVVTRGYARQSKGQVVVSDGAGTIKSVYEGGDEPVLIARRYPKTVVIACERRAAGIHRAIQEFGCGLILLDDAYQHRFVRRNADILLINASEPPGHYRLLPQGRLREPICNIRRADIVVLTKGDPAQYKQTEARISKYYKGPQYRAMFGVSEAVKADFSTVKSLNQLKGKKVVVFCGIAHEDQFRNMLGYAGFEIAAFMSFPDHYFYRQSDIVSITETANRFNCQKIVTTEKDLVRIDPVQFKDFDLLALRLHVDIDDGFMENVRRFIDKAGSGF